jgi:hypothetical protein
MILFKIEKTVATNRELAIGEMSFCGAPNNHAPLKQIMWRSQARAQLNNDILWHTNSTCATEMPLFNGARAWVLHIIFLWRMVIWCATKRHSTYI